jgi:hypothetical protein
LKILFKYVPVFLILICKTAFAQTFYIEGVVISKTSSRPIEYANIQDKSKSIGITSDSLGKFRLPISSKNTLLTVSCVGYENTSIHVNPESFVLIRLTPLVSTLDEVTIKPKENPAFEIIRRVLANSEKNNPDKILQFKANHYSKIGLNGEILTYFKKSTTDSVNKIDRGLFIVENLGDFYQKNKKQKDIVKFTISNFPKNYPVNIFTNNQINPSGFYEPLIQVNLNQLTALPSNNALQNQRFYVNPINAKTFSQYDFQLLDTLVNPTDSVFTILYKPKKGISFNALVGIMKINSHGYAIQEVSAKNADSLQTLNFKIHQNYQKSEAQWYPYIRTLNLEYLLKQENKEIKFIFSIEDYLSNFIQTFDAKEVYFDGTYRQILPKADTISRRSFDKLRSVELLLRDQQLYNKSEIINKKPLFQKVIVPGMAIVKTAMNNGLMLGPFFLLYNQFDYNQHENIRLGIGIQNDIQKSPRWRIYAGSAYGLEDKKLKYEGILSYHLTKDRYNKIEIYGGNDIQRPGQNPILLPNYFLPQRFGLNLGSGAYLLDNYKKIGLSVFLKPFNWTQFKVFYEKETREPLSYKLAENIVSDYNHAGLSIRFARKETLMRTGYFETVTNPYYPIIRLNVSHFNSNNAYHSNFWKANIVVSHQIRTKKVGKTMTNISAGNSWGNLPFQYLFNNLSVPLNIWGSNNKEGFQMLSTAQLGYNNYLSLSIFHDFEKNLWRLNNAWFQPEFMVGNKLAIGSLTQGAPLVNNKPLKDIHQGVFEASMSIRNILKVKIKGFGIGLGVNLVYDYSPDSFGSSRFGIRPFIMPVLF